MNRYEFQKLALARWRDAEVLLTNGRFEGAYYLSGYVVECGLKACIAKQTQQHDFPPRATGDYYTHNLETLLRTAQLKTLLDQEAKSDPDFSTNWNTVKDWSEETRYEPITPQRAAEDMLKAVNDPQHGVLQWIRRQW